MYPTSFLTPEDAMRNAQPLCPKCQRIVRTEERGHLYVFKCPRCGWGEWGTFFPADEGQKLTQDESVRVIIRWRDGRVTAEQATAAKKVVRALEGQSIVRFLAQCRELPTYELGLYPKEVAQDLKEEGRRHGLDLIIEPAHDAE